MAPVDVTVKVPATSANLVPGFDSFGLALELHNRFTARLAESWSVRVTGVGAGRLSESSDNQVAQAMARVFADVGKDGLAAVVECENEIPTGEGRGSSAAAIVGGMLLADRLCDARLDATRIHALAAEMEGHPDNVAAALLGGFTIAWDDGGPKARHIEPGRGLAAVVVTADTPLATMYSRSLLPRRVPHSDAAFSAGRAGALAAGMVLGDHDLMAAGLADRIHEKYRIPEIPDFEEIREILLDAGVAGAVLSGAGPTVVGLICARDDAAARVQAEGVAERAAVIVAGLPGRCAPRVLGVARLGAQFV